MALELAVESNGVELVAPVENEATALLVARQLIDAGVTKLGIREAAAPATAGAEVEGPSETPKRLLVYSWELEGDESIAGERMTAAAGAVDAAVETLGSGPVQAGDVGDDILSALRTADVWFDKNIFGTEQGHALLQATPYTQVVEAAHEARMEAMHGGGERQKREERQRVAAETAERVQANAEKRAAADAAEAARRETAMTAESEQRYSSATSAVVREAQGVTRAARRGDERALDRLAGIKRRAAQGDPEARRLFKIYNSVAQDDQDRIEAQLRAAG